MTTLERLNAFYENMLSAEECRKLLQEYAKTVDGFVIFGAMHTGIKLKRILEKYELKVCGFLDEYMEFDALDGKPVFHSMSDLQTGGYCFVLGANVVKSKAIMTSKLREGFPAVDILDQKVLLYCHYNGVLQRNDGLYWENVALMSTNVCTLRCRGCCTLIPEVESELRIHFPIEDLKRSIQQLSRVVDAVNNVEILGGEPFLHPQLAELIYCIRKQPNLFQIVIVTNGTIVPKKEVIDAMAASDVIVRISDYGKASTKKTECLNIFKRNNILTFIRPVNMFPWSDYGEIYDRGSGEIQFKNCRDRGCNVLYRGRIYSCGREMRYVEKNLYAIEESRSVNLSEEEEKVRKNLKLMMLAATPTQGCRYCGDMDKKIEAGVQEDR